MQDELLAELEEMEEEELNRQLLDVGGSVTDELPSVPSAEPSRPEPKVGMYHAGLWGLLHENLLKPLEGSCQLKEG